MVLLLSSGQTLLQQEDLGGGRSWRRDKNVDSALFREVTSLKRKRQVKVKKESYEAVL